MKKVAINTWFADQPTTGSGQYTVRLLDALRACAPDWEFAAIGPQHGSPIRRALGSNLHKVWFEQAEFPRLARRLPADVAHTPYWGGPLICGCPMVATIHDLIPLLLPEYRGGWRVQAYMRLVSASARRAAVVLTDSDASRRDILRHLRLPADRVRTVYLAADASYYPRPPDIVEGLRTRMSLPPRYVLYFGGFDVRKNLRAVVQAFARATSEGPDVSLVIAGRLPERDTPFAPDPRRMADEAGIAARTMFTGWVDEADKPALYSGAGAMLFPSRYEGFGLPPLEAMACGTPVIASHAASLPEIVGDGGMLYDPDDASGMGEGLAALLSNPSMRAARAEKALAQAGKFSWARTADETLRAYESAMGR
jgi:glycosyltransferase involved in cell wall biosynthesis